MESTKQTALKRAIVLLKAAGARYHIEVGGELYGEALFSPEHPAQRRTRNGVSDYVRPLVENMEVGEVVCIEGKDYTLGSVQSTANSIMARLHGDGAVITHQAPEKGYVEILRVH